VLAAEAAEAVWLMAGGKEARREQEAAVKTLLSLLKDETAEKLVTAVCSMMQMVAMEEGPRAAAARLVKVFLGFFRV
jgi:hypothetical protein